MSKVWTPIPPPAREFKEKTLKELSKTASFIYQVGESTLLRKKSLLVNVASIPFPEFQAKISYLRKCLVDYRHLTGKGRGIAAVQVGIPEQFLIFYRENKFVTMINPKVISRSREMYVYPEICMSANNLIASVIRPSWVEVEYRDEAGALCVWKVKATAKQGMIENRIIQHEIDHLGGIINIDLVNSSELTFVSNAKFYEDTVFKKIT